MAFTARDNTIARSILSAIAGAAVLAAAAAASRAGAQTPTAPNGDPRCVEKFNTKEISAAEVIRGCTAVIQAGKQTSKDLAIAYTARCGAYIWSGWPPSPDSLAHAIADCDQAIRLDPDHVRAFLSRSTAYADKGDYEHAIADISEAIRLQPTDDNGFSLRCLYSLHTGNYDRMIADCTQSQRIKNRSSTYAYLGYAHFLLANYDAAASNFELALRGQPDSAQDMLWLYLSRTRPAGRNKATSERDARAELTTSAGKLTQKGSWDYQVVQMFLGHTTAAAVLAGSKTDIDRYFAQFFIGEWSILQGNRADARSALSDVANKCPKVYYVQPIAAAELRQIK